MPKTRTQTPSTPARATSGDDAATLLAKLDAAQAELNALNSQLERLNRLATMGTIAGMIAHEFNNILTPMLSYAQMAAAAPDDLALSQKALQRTITGSERAAKIADAILNFVRDEDSRSESGAVGGVFHVEQGASTPCANVTQVVRDALACLAREPERDGISLAGSVPASLHARIQPIALQQVLVNLVLNAQNAMGNKGGGLEIVGTLCSTDPAVPNGAADSRSADQLASHAQCSTWNTHAAIPANHGWIQLVLRDTGPGIAPERLARMFTPFRSTNTSGNHRGTGLGMVISKRLIHAAGGWMIVESTLGRGTTVTIVLPAI